MISGLTLGEIIDELEAHELRFGHMDKTPVYVQSAAGARPMDACHVKRVWVTSKGEVIMEVEPHDWSMGS